jgi:glutaconate CoA-transferase subunit B
VDFITSPGYLTGPGAREAAGLPPDTGPYKVISTLGVMGFDPVSKRMQVDSLHPGVSPEEIQAATGFELLFSPHLETTPEPTDDQLEILRTQVDPQGMILGKPQRHKEG